MKISQFVIGKTFWVGSRKFRCTDICSHFIAAIELYRRDDPSWYNGPSYAVPEYAFGEPEMEACTPKAVTRAAAKEWRMRKGAKIVESTLSMHSRPPKVSKFPPALSFCPVPKAMELQDFAIGDLFLMSMHIMRCIDVGTRVAVGFDICHAKKRLKGAEGEPYSSEWIVDECDRHACTALYYLSDEELSFFRDRGKSGFRKQLQALLKTATAKQSNPDKDNPEWTDEMFAQAVPFSKLPKKMQESLVSSKKLGCRKDPAKRSSRSASRAR